MLARGLNSYCSQWCHGGINYISDPTVLITDNGHDFERRRTFGSAGTITRTSADTTKYLEVFVSPGATPEETDSTSHATVLTSGGFSIMAGSIKAGVAGTKVTTTVSHMWMDATAGVGNIALDACRPRFQEARM